MQHVKLGRTGLRVSRLCLGTMTFGLQCDVAQSNAILDAAAAGGVDFLDTADVYPLGGGHNTKGRTEQIVGDWLKGKRQQFILATKCVGQMGAKPWDLGMSRKHILDAIEASLRRLGTDYIDLYQLHSYDPHTPIDEALEALDDCRAARARRAMSASPTGRPTRWHAPWDAASSGTWCASTRCSRATISFSAASSVTCWPLCAEEAIAVIPYNPLAGGLLTGKHDRQGGSSRRLALPARHRRATLPVSATGTTRSSRPSRRCARSRPRPACSLATLAMRWVLSNPAITAPIIGASRPEQLADSIAASEQGALPDDLKAKLDEITLQWRAVDAER